MAAVDPPVDPSGDPVGGSTELKTETIAGLHYPADTDILDLFDGDQFRLIDVNVEFEKTGTGIRNIVDASGCFDDIPDKFLAFTAAGEIKSQITVVEHRQCQHQDKSDQTGDQDNPDRMRQRSVTDVDDEIRKTARHGDDGITDTAGKTQESFKIDHHTGNDPDHPQIRYQQDRGSKKHQQFTRQRIAGDERSDRDRHKRQDQ